MPPNTKILIPALYLAKAIVACHALMKHFQWLCDNPFFYLLQLTNLLKYYGMPQPGDSDLLSNTDGWSSKDTPDAELIKDESQISLDSPHKPLLKSSDAHTSFSNTSVDEHVKKVVPPLPSAGPMPVRPPSPSGTTVYSQQTSHTIVPLAMAMSAPMQMAVMPPYVGYVPGYVDLKGTVVVFVLLLQAVGIYLNKLAIASLVYLFSSHVLQGCTTV